jgi:hypothetical protein
VSFGRSTRVADRALACTEPPADFARTVAVVANQPGASAWMTWPQRYVQRSPGDRIPSPSPCGAASHPGSVTVTWSRATSPGFVTRIVSGTVEPTCVNRGAVFVMSIDGGQVTVSVTEASSSSCASAGSSDASTVAVFVREPQCTSPVSLTSNVAATLAPGASAERVQVTDQCSG